IHLAIIRCACFEHLEGEPLFTAVSAGFGKFECERLLKPSGIELMNLPRAANIEVSVFRRRSGADGERTKQMLYHGLVSLAAVRTLFWTPSVAEGEASTPPEVEQPLVWESWLGLFSSEVDLGNQ
ncbi:unnamed protein product, partial [Polarella glacialis]